jgi:hypothetical protein
VGFISDLGKINVNAAWNGIEVSSRLIAVFVYILFLITWPVTPL